MALALKAADVSVGLQRRQHDVDEPEEQHEDCGAVARSDRPTEFTLTEQGQSPAGDEQRYTQSGRNGEDGDGEAQAATCHYKFATILSSKKKTWTIQFHLKFNKNSITNFII